jgi:chromosome segregation ATPase
MSDLNSISHLYKLKLTSAQLLVNKKQQELESHQHRCQLLHDTINNLKYNPSNTPEDINSYYLDYRQCELTIGIKLKELETAQQNLMKLNHDFKTSQDNIQKINKKLEKIEWVKRE